MLGAKLKKICSKAKKDYYFFCKYVLDYNKMETQPHQELCDFTDGKALKKLILMPRGAYKSSVVTIGYAMWRLLHNPNLRILISGETQKNSRNFVKEIKTHYEQNERFRQLYGDWQSDNTWRDDEFIVKPRTIIKKEPTIRASSLEKQSTTGHHYDFIILDDPCSPLNVNTPEQIQKTIDYYRMLLSVLDPGGELIIIGTRYSALDLYGYISDPQGQELSQFAVYCKEAYDEKTGELLFPTVLTHEYLEQQKKSQGSWIFNCQYMNKPVSPDTAFFRLEDIQYYDDAPPGCVTFITFDPAISKGARSDYSAFIVNHVDYREHWYIGEAIQKKVDTNEIIEMIFYLANKYKDSLQCFAMEKFMLEQVLEKTLHYEQTKRGIFFTIVQLPQDTRISKEHRIRALQPRFQNGMIHYKRDMTELVHQTIYYPLGVKHDDLLDALKSQIQVVYPSDHVYDKQEVKEYNDKLDPVSRAAALEIKECYKKTSRKVKQTYRM